MNCPAKFAKVTYNLFSPSGRFQISVSVRTDLGTVAAEYRQLGCIVEVDQERRWLTVDCQTPVAA